MSAYLRKFYKITYLNLVYLYSQAVNGIIFMQFSTNWLSYAVFYRIVFLQISLKYLNCLWKKKWNVLESKPDKVE